MEERVADSQPLGVAWWVASALTVATLVVALVVLGVRGELDEIDVHRVVLAVCTAILVILANALGIHLVALDFDHGRAVSLRSFAGPLFTTREGYAGYLAGKLKAMFLALLPLAAALALYLLVLVAAKVLAPRSLATLSTLLALGAVQGCTQGLCLRLLMDRTAGAAFLLVGLLVLENALPLVCCLPTFNVPFSVFFLTEPHPSSVVDPGMLRWDPSMLIAFAMSAATQVVLIVGCLGLAAWRYAKLRAAAIEVHEREGTEPCRYCGERVQPTLRVCPACGEDDPCG